MDREWSSRECKIADMTPEARLQRVLNSEGENLAELADLLSRHFELRMEADPILKRTPHFEIGRWAVLCRAAGLNELDNGRIQEAKEWIESAIKVATEAEITDCLLDLSLIARDRTDWDTAIRLLDEAERRNITPEQTLRINNLRAVEAIICHRDLEEATSRFRLAEGMAAKLGDRGAQLTAVINRALGVERIRGNFAEMIACAGIIERAYGGNVPLEDQIYASRIRTEALFHLGRNEFLSECAQLVALGPNSETGRPNPQAAGYGYALLALWHSERGEVAATKNAADRVLALALPNNISENFVRLAVDTCDPQKCPSQLNSVPIWPPDRLPFALNQFAFCLYRKGSLEEAFAQAKEAEVAARNSQCHFETARAQLLQLAVRFSKPMASELVVKSAQSGYQEAFSNRHSEVASLVWSLCVSHGVEPEICAGWSQGPSIVISVLGELRVVRNGKVIERNEWSRPKARALFAYLACQQDRWVDVEQAIQDIWPDADTIDGRNAFRVACTYIRNAVGFECIERSEERVRLHFNVPCFNDLVELRRLARFGVAHLPPLPDQEPLADLSSDIWCLDIRDEVQSLYSKLRQINS